MSIFSNIRKSRQQAKEHNAKLAEQKKKEEDSIPYRHVPTHAAIDAFASAPPSWRETADRPKIIEQNRRRNAMAASGHHMNIPAPNFPRVGSSLSYVSYPGQANPKARMPRAYSYNGVSPYTDGSRDIIYPIPDVAHSEPECLKEDSPLESNSDSNGSQEDLEMKNSKAVSMTRPATATETVHRLHPSSRSRRTSDASLDHRAMTNSANNKAGPSKSSRDSRPPPSTRGFNALPASAVLVPVQARAAASPLLAAAIAPTVRETRNSSSDSSRQNSSSSLPGLTPTSIKHPSTFAQVSPSPLVTPPPDLSLDAALGNRADTDRSYFEDPTSATAAAPTRKSTDRPGSKVTRFTELESSGADDISIHALPPAPHAQVVNFFPEPAAPEPEPAESKKGKRKKPSKGGGGGKLLKKNRRSTVQAPA